MSSSPSPGDVSSGYVKGMVVDLFTEGFFGLSISS